MEYTDPQSLDTASYQHTARTKDNKYVYGTSAAIEEAGATKCTYEEGESAGNNWNSLHQPRS